MVHDARKNGVAGFGELARAHAHPKVGAGERRRSCKSVVGGCWRREGRRDCAPSGHKSPSKSRSKRQLPARPRVKWRKASEKREEEARREKRAEPSRSLFHFRFDPRRLSPVSQHPVDQPSRFLPC